MHRFRSTLKRAGTILAGLLGGVLLVAIAIYLIENRRPTYRTLTPVETAQLTTLLRTRGEPPADYVLHKFASHPVVILGEPHRVREHYEFLIGLLPFLPDAGVNQVAIELFQKSSQPHIDQLLRGETFDEPLARRIVLSAVPYFYYEELYLIIQKAWEVNHGGRRLRILGLYGEPDQKKAQTVSQAVNEAGKTLVYVGAHHAFINYSQPEMLGRKSPVRMGTYLKQLGRNPFFIGLHYPAAKRYWFYVPLLLYRKAFCLPFGGVLDQIFRAHGAPVGFDTALPELDIAADTFSYYAHGRPQLRLSEYSDGYIYLTPLDQYRFVRPLHDIAGSEQDRAVLRELLGEQDQKRVFGSERKAVRLLESDGVTSQRMLSNLDMRGLDDVLAPLSSSR
jgi:hypothetical protein